MALHREAQAVLDGMQASGMRPFIELSPQEARAQSRAFRRPDPGAPAFETHDTEVRGSHGPIKLRFYPGGSDAGVVFFHGGGWVYGDLDMADSFCRFLTRMSGATVMSVDYHLAPEHRYPSALDDAVIAVQWLMQRAHDYAIDPDKLAVCGSSAGGNLAAAACLKLRDQGAPLPALQVLLCPALDASMSLPSYDEHADGGFLTRTDMAHYWSAYLGDGADTADPYASPLHAADLSGLPPALVVTAGADPLRDDGERYADRLREAGVDAECLRFDGQLHAFPMTTTVSASKLVIGAMAARLRG
ncbi:MAG: alpha/beta hydrolase [Acidimicrobiales bacterium]